MATRHSSTGSRARSRWPGLAAAAPPLVLIAGLLTGCGPAHGTVEVRGSDLHFTAAAGKANNVSVRSSGADLLVRDTADTLAPGNGCTAVDANTARCTGVQRIFMDLGDQDDVATNNTDRQGGVIYFPAGAGTQGIVGGPGNDVLNGGTNSDLLIGDEGADTLNGNGGSDLLREGRTAASTDELDVDTFNGGPGTRDLASFSSATEPVTLDLDGVADDGRVNEGDRVAADIEELQGGEDRDVLRGDARDNVLSGDGDDDELVGNLGVDVFKGYGGNDLLREGIGAANVDPLDGDVFIGDGGVDTVSYQGATFQVQVDIDPATVVGADDGRPSERDEVREDVENVTGGAAEDVLTGDGDANELVGNGGPDTINGNGSDDVLRGDAADDEGLQGIAGFDLLNGADGDHDDCDVGGIGAAGGSEFGCEV